MDLIILDEETEKIFFFCFKKKFFLTEILGELISDINNWKKNLIGFQKFLKNLKIFFKILKSIPKASRLKKINFSNNWNF